MAKKKNKRKKHHKKHKFIHNIPKNKQSSFRKSDKKKKISYNQDQAKEKPNQKTSDYFRKDVSYIFILTIILLIVMMGLFYLVDYYNFFDPVLKWIKLG